jgi:hypothetical protein
LDSEDSPNGEGVLTVQDISLLQIKNQKENDMNKNIVSIALKGVAVAMGVAVIMLNALGTLAVETAVTLLSIGLTALAIESLQK